MEGNAIANRNTYFGLFLITLSVLMNEILLTRIFSVITYYHFAFMAISIVMFGMTVGSMLVFLLPQYQNNKNLHFQLAYTSLLFSITIVLAFVVLAKVPIDFQATMTGLIKTIFIYCVLAMPFVFGGMSICLVLTKFDKQINSLYAADLIGAGVGCIMIILVLNYFSGPKAVVVAALFGLLSTVFFAENTQVNWLKKFTLGCMILFVALITFNSILEFFEISPLHLDWVKNKKEVQSNYEKWNSFSRITVTGNPNDWIKPFTQGLSSLYQLNQEVHGMNILIDANAATFLMNYHNDQREIDFLRYDLTGFANYLKPNAKVLIVGVGGGRDVLTALAFNQPTIVGIEINPIIVNLLKNEYSFFSGNINSNPRVSLINAEGRSFVAQLKQNFDIIQVSLIDTWAATAAGAYVLSENSLFTTQAWRIFLKHLNPNGVLTVTRWYTPENPAELYRLTAISSKALQEMGVTDPASHIMIFASGANYYNPKTTYVGNIIVSPTPFTQMMINQAEYMASKLNFDILYTPNHKNNLTFFALASNHDINSISDHLGLDISAPTDDKPFFFEMLKLKKYLHEKLWNQDSYYLNNNPYISASRALTILLILLITVISLTLLCIVIPLMLRTNRQVMLSAFPFLIYFSSIGLGFMFIEISQLQRFVLFLGPPTYGLSVILFGLLVSSGLGSLFTYNYLNSSRRLFMSQLMLLLMIVLFGYFTTNVISYYQASSLLVRILVSLAVIFSLGFFMGSALPLGMQLASKYSTKITPWLWGVNGATSICGSVLAMVVALSAGIQSTYLTGLLCYCLAFAAICYVYFRKSVYSTN